MVVRHNSGPMSKVVAKFVPRSKCYENENIRCGFLTWGSSFAGACVSIVSGGLVVEDTQSIIRRQK